MEQINVAIIVRALARGYWREEGLGWMAAYHKALMEVVLYALTYEE